MGTPMKTLPKPSRRRRSPCDLTARYDRSNDEAATLILSAPNRNPKFLLDWAKAFQQRRARESREAVRG